MIDLIFYVVMFYVLHLFLKMGFSSHKIPFVNFTHVGGDISNMTELSNRVALAADNLRQTLPVFLTFSVLSVVLDVENLLLAQIWFGLRIVYLIGAILNLYTIPLLRPAIWVPSVIVLVMMGTNLL